MPPALEISCNVLFYGDVFEMMFYPDPRATGAVCTALQLMPGARTLACKPDRSRQNVPASQQRQIEVVHEARRCHGHGGSLLLFALFCISGIPSNAIVRYYRLRFALASKFEDVNISASSALQDL